MHSIESEQAVLGSLLIDNSLLDDLDLVPDDFAHFAHKIIFETMIAMDKEGTPYDVISLYSTLGDKGDEIGGMGYLGKIIIAVAPQNASAYAKIIKNKTKLRKLARIGSKLVELAHSRETADSIIDFAQSEVLKLDDQQDTGVMTVNEILPGVIDGIDARFQNGSELSGLSTGFVDIDKKTTGLHPGELIVIAGRPSMGKELSLDSDVLLSTGEFKKMCAIEIGDKVASIDGSDSVVYGVFPQGKKPVYKIKFGDGRSVEAGLEHQWEVMYREWPSPRIMTTEEIINKLKFKRYKKRLYIPRHTGGFGDDRNIIINPYLLGVLLGDGGLSQGSIILTTSYDFILNKIKPHLLGVKLRKKSAIEYRLSTDKGKENKLLNGIKSLGLMGLRSYEKFIPEQYLTASKESRLELMRGLIDTDGTVEKTGPMTYTTTSKVLADNFQRLARSLGAFASMTSRFTFYTYLGERKKGKEAYTIYISCKHYSDFVTLPKKKSRTKNKERQHNLNIDSIEYIGELECQCISVTHPRKLYLTNDYICTHNTALASNIARHNALTGKTALFFSLEMPNEQLINREIAAIGSINLNHIRSGQLEEHDWPRLTTAVGHLNNTNLLIDDNAALSVNQIRSRSRKAKKKHGLDLIVVDYLQLMEEKGESRTMEIEQISRGLKGLAKELNVPVIALSQLNRELEKRPNKRPMMSDLRQSGAIEQDADLILFVYRDEVYNEDSPDKGTAEIIIAKQRNGEIGKVRLVFQGHYCRFNDYSGAEYETH